MKYLYILSFLFFYFNVSAQENRWEIIDENQIKWDVIKNKLPHYDHIEMSGTGVSAWIRYGADARKKLSLNKTLVFPSFRTIPNNTHGSFMYSFGEENDPRIFIDQVPYRATIYNGKTYKDISEEVQSFSLNGLLCAKSIIYSKEKNPKLSIVRKLYPSVYSPAFFEVCCFKNISTNKITINVEQLNKIITIDSGIAYDKKYFLHQYNTNTGFHQLSPGDSLLTASVYEVSYSPLWATYDIGREEEARLNRVREISQSLQLITPDSIINTAFSFAKLRATESIFKTKNGLIHCPGGLSYYAAIWANDQAEYANPFFPYLGDPTANKAAMNAYHWFARYINDAYTAIPSSIIAEGTDYWNGAGDRGDQAMIAYGAARCALALGDKDSCLKLLPLIDWCLEYCRRKINSSGVVDSDSDELEGRFPAGTANLCTSSLYYDALISTYYIYNSLGLDSEKAQDYWQRAQKIKKAIESYFGASIGGYDTYRYYKGNTLLRSWICIPLSVGIFERKAGTIAALFSPALWSDDGLRSQEGDSTFWDRSTLYALRGVLAAGDVEAGIKKLKYYSARRLLGEHVPYPVEAYPEGNQRHLSAESALYCRIITEGLFGIRPTGLRQFLCTPQLPAAWERMELKHIKAFGCDFSILVEKDKQKIKLLIHKNDQLIYARKINNGEEVLIKL
jgi:hypothetical protein